MNKSKSRNNKAARGRPTVARRIGLSTASPKLPILLKELENHPAELELAQRLYIMRVIERLSYPKISEKTKPFNKGKLIPVSTVYNYVKAYRQVAYRHMDDDPVRDAIAFCEAEISLLLEKRKKSGKKVHDFVSLTREIREYIDKIMELQGIKQPPGPQVAIMQNFIPPLPPEKVIKIYDILDKEER
jgi:hypothetical protein